MKKVRIGVVLIVLGSVCLHGESVANKPNIPEEQPQSSHVVREKGDFGVKSDMQFETDRIVRGRRNMVDAFTGQAKVYGYVTDNINFYGNIKGVGSLSHDDASHKNAKIEPSGGCVVEYGALKFDVGYIHHFRPGLAAGDVSYKRNSSEVYAGFIAHYGVTSSIYGRYDFDTREMNLEGNVNYGIDLSKYLLPGISLDLGGKVGFDQWNRYAVTQGYSKGYFYYGANLDLVYKIKNGINAYIGAEFVGNTASKGHWSNKFHQNGATHNGSKLMLTGHVGLETSF